MNLSRIILACLLTCLSHQCALAQHPESAPIQYHSVQWNIEDGLVDSRYMVMIKDVKGFLWCGSNAKNELSRFDGVIFKKYTPQPNKTEATSIGNIQAIKEDSLHNIWIGAERGLMRYDISADTFSFFVGDMPGKSDKTIIPFWATNDQMFCVESQSKIVSYHIQSLKKKVLLENKLEDLQILIRLYMIYDSSSNSIWVPAKDMNREAMALVNISLSDGQRQYFRWPCTRPQFPHFDYVEGMKYDRNRHSFWLNTGDGLFEFSLRDMQFHFVEAFAEFIKLKDYDRWAGLDLDNFGRVWVPTSLGIIIYDPRTRSARKLFSIPELQKQTADHNFQVYCDREDIVWLSYWSPMGIRALLPQRQPVTRYYGNRNIKDSLSNGKVISIVPGPNGKIWIGTSDGMNIFDPESEKFEVLREKDLPGFRGKGIIPLLVDTIHQVAWLNSASTDPFNIYKMQMYEMDLQTKKCRPVFFGEVGKRLNEINMTAPGIMPVKNGFLFSEDIYGVYEVTADSNIAKLVVPFDKRQSITKSILIEGKFLFLKVYLSLPNLNYEFKNKQWIRMKHQLDTLEWTSMLYDKIDKSYWVSLKNELVHFDSAFGKIKAYRKEDGYNGETIEMLMDNSHNLWMVDNFKHLCRLDMTGGSIYTLSEEDGFAKKDFDWSVPFTYDARGGSLYLGTGFEFASPHGLDRIHTEKRASPNTTIPYLRSLSINRKIVSYPGGVANIEALWLSYTQNTIGIECGIIDFYARGKGRIRYKLELQGKTREWIYPQRNEIQLDDLVPGEYQLTIQASNVGNVFNSLEKTLKISISPPFWETWWFRILALIVGIAIIYGIIQYRSRNLKLRNKQLEEKVIVRTNELKHSLEELKETQTQLIQREKMASLGELTAGIAHEIQNPLNFVNNFSEVSAELVGEMKAEMKTGNSDEALNIADDIEANLQKIVRHGKRADAIVRGMLQHSRSSSGEKLPTDLNALTDEYLRLSYHGMKAKDKSFIATIHTEFDKRLSGSDPDGEKIVLVSQEIGRVLLNLFNNAFYAVGEKKKTHPQSLKESNEYEPKVIVTTKLISSMSAGGVRAVEIRVKDNGMGIQENILNKIFQPFFTTKPTGEGTGLGLSLSYDIITKMHGGELKVETVEGEGTEFTVQLPI